MKIKTITCHDVYNAGASLQAYALQHYLQQCGHDVEIIDYKPDYLSGHYKFSLINTPRYNKPFIRELYLFAHFPQRFRAYVEGKKQRFDQFKSEYLIITKKRYHSFDELRDMPPEAECFIAGSDQIWNPYLPNGSDPSFYLQFTPDNVRRISFAASFATDALPDEKKQMVKTWLTRMDSISVREKSGLNILAEMGIKGTAVCDPVFLLEKEEWKELAVHRLNEKPYILVYDFENNEIIQTIALNLAKRKNTEVVSVLPVKNKTIKTARAVGPREFLSLILFSEAVVSNSFHAVAFSLIFHKEMFVLKRNENLNARMIDLLGDVGLQDRLVNDWAGCDVLHKINWDAVDRVLEKKIENSKMFLTVVVEGGK